MTVQDDPVHEYTKRQIWELWIPSIGAVVNDAGGLMFIDRPRVDSGMISIEVDDATVEKIKNAIIVSQEYKNTNEELWSKIKSNKEYVSKLKTIKSLKDGPSDALESFYYT